MTIVKIEPESNGAHSNQTSDSSVSLPEGWALLPESMGTPETLEHYPFGEITVADVDGVPTVTNWTPLPIPKPKPVAEPQYTEIQLLAQQVTDLELLVLGGKSDV